MYIMELTQLWRYMLAYVRGAHGIEVHINTCACAC